MAEGSALGYSLPWWTAIPLLLVSAGALYFALRGRLPGWLLVLLIVVLAPVGVLVLLVGTLFLGVVILTLSTMVALRLGGVNDGAVGELYAYPWWLYSVQVYVLGFLVLLIAYLIRRR